MMAQDFLDFNPNEFHESFAQDIDSADANILAIKQKPFNQSIIAEASGPPARKNTSLHGIRYPRMIACYVQICNIFQQNE